MAAYQNAGFAYQGTGEFAYQVGTGVVTVRPQTSANWGRKKRKKKVLEPAFMVEPSEVALLDFRYIPVSSLEKTLIQAQFDKEETEEEDNMLVLTISRLQ